MSTARLEVDAHQRERLPFSVFFKQIFALNSWDQCKNIIWIVIRDESGAFPAAWEVAVPQACAVGKISQSLELFLSSHTFCAWSFH